MAVERGASARIDPIAIQRLIENATASPQAKGQLTRRVNREGQKLLEIAQGLAEKELHRRPAERRTKESLAHGKEYHDSFYVKTANPRSPREVAIRVGNDHPAASIIEDGAVPHYIFANTSSGLRFPGSGGEEARGGIVPVKGKHSNFRQGKKGTFPVNGPPWAYRDVVEHPGVNPRRILARATDQYRKQTKAIVRGKGIPR